MRAANRREVVLQMARSSSQRPEWRIFDRVVVRETPAHEQIRVFPDLVVEAHVGSMSVIAQRNILQQIVFKSIRVRKWNERQNRSRGRRDAAGRNNVVREQCPDGWRTRRIEQSQAGDRAEIARTIVGRGHGGERGDLLPVEIPLVADEEKGGITADRSAGADPGLVRREAGLLKAFGIEEVPRAHAVIRIELEQAAMEVVRAVTRRRIENASAGSAVLRVVIAGEKMNFLRS